jgi:putative component of toxin-antitoxin plasmid stabilization module
VTYTIEFFEDDDRRTPARDWLMSLDRDKRAAVVAAIEVHLEQRGIGICATEHGKQLGSGIFELRVRHDAGVTRGSREGPGAGARRDDILLRVFCHAYGDRIVLLLGGYDKGASPSERRQQLEIERAKKALRSFKLQQSRQRAGRRRRRQ